MYVRMLSDLRGLTTAVRDLLEVIDDMERGEKEHALRRLRAREEQILDLLWHADELGDEVEKLLHEGAL